MKCDVVQDLLPSYADGLTSEESNREIEKHLKTCEKCSKYYREMTGEVPEDPAESGRDGCSSDRGNEEEEEKGTDRCGVCCHNSGRGPGLDFYRVQHGEQKCSVQ